MLHISYLYRIHAATFLPFRAYSIDNQLIIDTHIVKTFPPISSLTSFNVLAKKYLNYDSNRIQAQEARKQIKEIPRCGDSFYFLSKPAYNSEILSKFVVLMTILSRISQLVLI